MPMINLEDHNVFMEEYNKTLEAEQDERQDCRDAKLFLHKRDGQWDPYAIAKLDGRFRGTFDVVTPIVDQIAGEMEQNNFTLRVSPAGGDSSMDAAKTFDGMIRNIRNMSNAEHVFNSAGRSVVECGFDCWEIVQDYTDDDSFDQDLLIKPIANAIDSVWFDVGSTLQDRSDAKWAVKLIALPIAEYKERYPDRHAGTIGTAKVSEAYWDKAEVIVIGQLYYKKYKDRTLVKMSDGSILVDDDDFKSIADELERQGIVEVDRRKRKETVVYSRMLDNDGWINEPQETVFSYIPIVPVYGDFNIIENKVVYNGKIERLYDQQRTLNYALSRDIEDGALSPSPSVWMTDEQAEGNDYSNMNVDHAPVRIYNHVDGQPLPQFIQNPLSNPTLQGTAGLMRELIGASANIFLSQQGNASPNQSGIAGAQQIEQGNIGMIKWMKSLEIAIQHTGRILIDAIPKVYDATRMVRVLEEDGTSSMTEINKIVFDQQTQKNVTVNNLAAGKYDVVCEVGAAFNNKQKETAQAFLDMASIDPAVAQNGMDIWLKNQTSPGMDQMSERYRVQLFNAGLIPESQWTDEERQLVAQQQALAAQQPPKEDPAMVLARAEEGKALAEQTNAQTKQLETQSQIQLKGQELQIKAQEVQLDAAKFEREKNDKYNFDLINSQLKAREVALKEADSERKAMKETIELQQKQINDVFTNLEKLTKAYGIDGVVSPQVADTVSQQVKKVDETQDK